MKIPAFFDGAIFNDFSNGRAPGAMQFRPELHCLGAASARLDDY
jgi:hypothetical protein